MKVLILCTGNTCRSQMAEGFLNAYRPQWEVSSAGVQPGDRVHPLAVRVMAEVGLDLSHKTPRHVQEFIGREFDYVITVCDGARDQCPVFTGRVNYRLHLGFEEPAVVQGTEEHVLRVFRRIREEIKIGFQRFADNVSVDTTTGTRGEQML